MVTLLIAAFCAGGDMAVIVPPGPTRRDFVQPADSGHDFWWTSQFTLHRTAAECCENYRDRSDRLNWKPSPNSLRWTPQELEWDDGTWHLTFTSPRRDLPYELRFSHFLPPRSRSQKVWTPPARMGRFMLDVF